MKVRFFLVILALFLGLLPAIAQQEGAVAIAAAIRSPVATQLDGAEGEQAGSVAIAGNIRSEEEKSELDEFAECVSKMKIAGASYKEASKDCREYRKVLAKESTRIANEAADATKASRPMVYNGYGNYGYRSYGYSYPRRTVVVRPAAPPRPAPPQRQTPPTRTPRPSR
ncbi:MAG: hypothetical protein AAB350_02975 [Patescibacteria group bacterium]